MKPIPDKRFSQLWNLSFGFFGVQIAYALQSANISRIVEVQDRAVYVPDTSVDVRQPIR